MTITRMRELRALARCRENIIDLDIAVDDARQALDRAVEQLREAVAARKDANAELVALLEMVEAWSNDA